jgi:phosphatidylserine/phosphatidylglycerophosphate/cardiolipin synthase-like enzyme
LRPSTEDLWPADVAPDLTGVSVAISRTVPAPETRPAVRECEALFHDSIARARRTIYIESQYFTSGTLAELLAARLKEADGPEVILVTPDECHGWLEQKHDGRVSRRSLPAAHGGRCPQASADRVSAHVARAPVPDVRRTGAEFD